MSTASWVGFIVLLWATVIGTWFMIAYSLRGNWWRPPDTDPHSEHRAHLGYFTLNLTLTFWLYDFRPVIEPTVFGWLRAGLFAWIAVNMTWRLWLLLKPRNQRLPDVS
jgi:hypothetical protein